MQYILTQEELDATAPKADLDKWKEAARVLAYKLAIATRGYCIHPKDVDEARRASRGGGYCDDCPAHEHCPMQKHWSK